MGGFNNHYNIVFSYCPSHEIYRRKNGILCGLETHTTNDGNINKHDVGLARTGLLQ